MSDCDVTSISSKSVLKEKLFTVEEYTIQLKNGKTVKHEDVLRHPTVSVFPLTEKNEIYLIKQYRYLLKAVTLEAVAGFINEGENPLAAAKRELKEETGIAAYAWEEIARLEMSASVVRAQSHVFLAQDLEIGLSKPEEDENIELVKMPLAKALEKVFTGEITTSVSVTGLLMLERLKKKGKK